VIRRTSAAAWLAMVLVLVSPGIASAHGLGGGTLELPVPASLFVFGAAAALIISFAALAVLWKEPKLEQQARGRPLPLQGLLRSPAIEWFLRLASLAFFLVVMVGALGGSRSVNLAPVAVYIWFWVGLAFLCGFLGNWWATLSPFDTLARLLGLGAEARRGYPVGLARWPAVVVLFGFVWLELVNPWAVSARPLGVIILGYTLVTLTGMAVFGRERWGSNAEGFAVFFDLLGRCAILGRDAEGRAVLRPPLAGLPQVSPGPGLVPFVCVMLGSTAFDGLTRLQWWGDRTMNLTGASETLTGTVGLVAVIVLVWAVFMVAMFAAGSIGGTPARPLAVRFAHTLVPIAFAYIVAHYFAYLLVDGQQGLRLLSDPFGMGWNLLGTADWAVNRTIVTQNTVWYVQVFAIIAGHIGGVILAHDRAVAMWEPREAVRTQYAFLGAMVLFTAMGLLILSGA
jgi:hypothetical protein